ncbi:helix-turn-helix domain-containing protein, partial [Nocardiopsis sp. CC223A]|uniref:helix-turn-helix domain-containing protein n=1 Tax=Nocardiopsis sp. CC223A TaxID=3044051 RepID=UPI002795D925
MDAAEHFARGEKTGAIARRLRVTERSVRRWRHAWEQGGAHALRSAGPVSTERLSDCWVCVWLREVITQGSPVRKQNA